MTSSEAPEHPEAIRVTEALSGESTQEVGGDATNEAGPEDSQPAAAVLPTGNSTAMADEGNSLGTPVAALAGTPEDQLKEVTLRTAPQDARFPTTNQSRRCYVAYNEYYKCIKEKGKESGDCKPHMRAYRSICPDEWIAQWEECRENGTWWGKY